MSKFTELLAIYDKPRYFECCRLWKTNWDIHAGSGDDVECYDCAGYAYKHDGLYPREVKKF